MKRLTQLLVMLAMAGALAACDGPSQPEVGTTPAASPSLDATAPTPDAPAPGAVGTAAQGNSIELGTFQFDEFAELNALGCGMTLWTVEENAKSAAEREFLLINGLDDDTMLMRIDGDVTRFNRTEMGGEEFYGQAESQTFVSQDGGITVDVDVELGEPGEIESVAIDSGTVQVERGDAAVEVAVVGDAGC
ncbi:MAG: hypothetical protein KME20_19060 [Kaiparowitsia implicata GSE-PSE-MK54-09C]|jgi:hypothetical protein|nr:hypothetical protein [Kaiparowitsia implicata GSE-PSE-MK54-09C]